MRKRAKPHATVAGRVVYERPLHKFTEKDALRVMRSLIDDNIEALGPFLATFIIQLFRVVLTYLRKTEQIREFLVSFASQGLPKIIGEVLYTIQDKLDEGYEFVLNYLVSWMSGLKPSRTLKSEEEEG